MGTGHVVRDPETAPGYYEQQRADERIAEPSPVPVTVVKGPHEEATAS